MIKIEKTMIIDRYNLIDTDKKDDDRYIRQITKKEVIELGINIIQVLGGMK